MSFEFPWVSIFNFELLDLLRDSITHPSQMLLSFEFAQSLCFQFRASQYITGLIRSSELKVIASCIFYELLFSITSVSIYYGTQSDIRVNSYCCLHFLRASIFNFDHLDILRDSIENPSQYLLSFEFTRSFCFQFRASWYMRDSIGHPSKNLLSFEFPLSFCFQFCESRYTTGFNRTFQ